MPIATLSSLFGMTPIHVFNNYTHKPIFGPPKPVTLNIRVSGAGVGGCDIVIPGGGGVNSTDNKDCKCLWGTVGYQFRAYTTVTGVDGQPDELILCADTKSLGNCYHTSGYSCEVSSEGFCHCKEQ